MGNVEDKVWRGAGRLGFPGSKYSAAVLPSRRRRQWDSQNSSLPTDRDSDM